VVKVVGLIAVIAAVVSLFLPNYYESRAVLLPSTNSSPMLSGSLTSLASLAGVSLGNTSPELMYPAIIKSESVLKGVIGRPFPADTSGRSFDLIQYYDISEDTPEEDFEETLEELRADIGVSVDRENSIVTVTFISKYPEFTAAVLNAVVSGLDEFLRTERITTASEQRKWIDDRLSQVTQELAHSEDSLKVFSEKNRRIENSPQLLLEQQRLFRDVEINSALYMELKKQLELIKIEEIKNVPVVSIMDDARPAAKKTKPKRLVIVVVVSLLGGVCAIAYVLLNEYYGHGLRKLLTAFQGEKQEESPEPRKDA
jgi:uncharacterized protein involved in exopolysaccharide biosynthesis